MLIHFRTNKSKGKTCNEHIELSDHFIETHILESYWKFLIVFSLNQPMTQSDAIKAKAG